MEINPNVDDLLREHMTGTKLEPLPEVSKVEEVSRETTIRADAIQPDAEPEPEVSKGQTKPDSPKANEPEPSTNEYGDKAEPQAKQEETLENEYGLEVEAPKTYSKAEMDEYANRLMRDRVARFERNQQQAQSPTQQQQVQAAQQGFQYDENSNQDWQQQLETFVMQVADKREQSREAQFQKAVEQESMQRFETKFKQGMDKFNDYHTVLAGKQVTDAMLMAASEISDPAALFYAAAKRMPDELAKIKDIKNPYAQAMAIGQLDAKLRKESVKVSNAPKPISPSKADSTTVYAPKEKSSNELDDMLVSDNKKRVAQLNARRR